MIESDFLELRLEAVDDFVGFLVGHQTQADSHSAEPREPMVMMHAILGAPTADHPGSRIQKCWQVGRADAIGQLVKMFGFVRLSREAL